MISYQKVPFSPVRKQLSNETQRNRYICIHEHLLSSVGLVSGILKTHYVVFHKPSENKQTIISYDRYLLSNPYLIPTKKAL